MKIQILQLGVGNIGRELIKQVLASRPRILSETGIELTYAGIFSSKNGVFNPSGITDKECSTFPITGLDNADRAVQQIPEPFIVVDVTPSNKTAALLKQALDQGGWIVMANKHPLAGSQSDFDRLAKAHSYFEATVGAGLPVISTILDLLSTGDEVESITGCFSGTLGYIFSELESGSTFSTAVQKAMENGLTEPDPRDDLSGTDVGRKAVILARLIGRNIELEDVPVESLFPEPMSKLSVTEFINSLHQVDSDYEAKLQIAKNNRQVLRYQATVTRTSCEVKLKPVSKNSYLGQLSGPDNVIVIRTKRYHDNPIVIKGPGAGVSVTASGVFADILKASRIIKGAN